MGPLCNSQGKYAYSKATLSTLHICQFCGKQFKVQGIKRHETGCKKQQELQKEQAEHGKEFERERHKGEFITFKFLLMPDLIYCMSAARKKAQLLDDCASISASVAPRQHPSPSTTLNQPEVTGSSHAICEHVDGDVYGDDDNSCEFAFILT